MRLLLPISANRNDNPVFIIKAIISIKSMAYLLYKGKLFSCQLLVRYPLIPAILYTICKPLYGCQFTVIIAACKLIAIHL